jgi:hypothetical protein
MEADEGSRGGKAGICMFVVGPGGASLVTVCPMLEV